MTADREELDAIDLRRRLAVSAYSCGAATTDQLADRPGGVGIALGIVIGILASGGVLLPGLIATSRPKPAGQDAVAVSNAANIRPQPRVTASPVAPTPAGSPVPVDTPAGPVWADSSDAATSPASTSPTPTSPNPTSPTPTSPIPEAPPTGMPARAADISPAPDPTAPTRGPATVPPASVSQASLPRGPTVPARCQQLIPTGVGRVTTRRIDLESGSEVGLLVRPRSDAATAYLTLGRRAYQIENTRTLLGLGYHPEEVRAVTASWFAHLSLGARFTAPSAGRVRHDVAAHAYYLWDGQVLHRIQGRTTLLLQALRSGRPQAVTHTWVTSHRLGAPVRAAGLPDAPPPVVAPERGAFLACLALDGRAGIRVFRAASLR